ncbi:MAG: DMT family transporter [Chloroflexi bacterium]|nr:DMT family transporter [Chloroflexota bacterium]
MKPKHWLVFILLGAVWSSSFLWIKIALQEIGPFTLVGFRVFFGLVATLAIAAFARSQWPRERATWLMLMLLGITNTAVPFVLISWGEIYIDLAVESRRI